MKIKTLSKALALGFLLSNIPISSLAGTLSEDGRYETFIDDNITIRDILEEDKTDIKIEGNTLVNLVQYSKNKLFCRSGNNNISLDINDDCATYKTVENTSSYITINTGAHNLLKSNTTYTIFFTIYENQIPNYNGLSIRGTSDAFFGSYSDNLYFSSGYELTKGNHSITFTTPIDISNYTGLGIGFKNILNSVDADLEFKIGNIMLIEGDYESTDFNYFKGIQSSFEDKLITQEMVDNGQEKSENLGKYKVEVKTTGKNLWNGTLAQQGMFAYDEGYDIDSAYHARTPLIKVKPNTQYTFNMPNWCVVTFFDINKKAIDYIISTTLTTFTTPDSCSYIRFRNYVSNDNALEILSNQVQLEEGCASTNYEPYKESIKTFYLNSPLLEGDTIEYINNNATHIKRFEKIVLNGSENWTERTMSSGKKQAILKLESTVSGGICYCDNFPTTIDGVFFDGVIYEGIVGLGIIYNSSTITSLDSLIAYLQENPTTVVYQLKNPIHEPIKADLTVQLFKGTTHMSNNSNIPINMEIIIDRAINRATEAIELAKEIPTIDNLSQARMWINMLKESALKDDFNNQINAITKIDDLEIELKKATSNMDIYIKSQNGLSMSLSTNSIIFDEFDSTEDMEKLNAVNLTINSSLPYQLNSYMMTELQNKDGSNIIPKELFNIRLNGETNYKAFTSINEKLVLKDDCQKGNNNQFNIDLILKGSLTHKADVYKATIKFEAEQK